LIKFREDPGVPVDPRPLPVEVFELGLSLNYSVHHRNVADGHRPRR